MGAAVRELGMTYSTFINGLSKASIDIDRKVLADLAVHDKAAFTRFAEQAKASSAYRIRKKRGRRESRPPSVMISPVRGAFS